jgi:hypothetical protein
LTVSIRHLDLRESAPNPPPPKTRGGRISRIAKVYRGRVVERAPADVCGITIHQTACVFGPLDDREKAYRRAHRISTHATAFADGTFVSAFPLTWYMHHGNGTNASSLGLECEGRYPGLVDDPATPRREDIDSTWGGPPTPLDERAVDTFRAALRWLVETGRAEGMPIEFIWAHRQSSAMRRSDPGAEIWRRVVLDYAVPELGLKTEPARIWGSGKPIPRAWDTFGVGRY